MMRIYGYKAEPGETIAGDIAFTPAGDIAATDMQAAIEELDSEKARSQSIPDLISGGPGYWFDGVNDEIVVAADANINFKNNMSAVMCITPSSFNAARGLFEKYTVAGNQRAYYLSINNSGNLEFRASSNGTSSDTFTSALGLSLSVPSMVSVTFDSGVVKIHINGESESDTLTETSIFDTSTSELNIGSRSNSGGSYFNGMYSSLSLFNITLSDTEVKAFLSGAAIPQKWLKNATDKPGEVRNSGNFVVGAEYRIKTRTDGNFISAGAADNNVGTEFVATATAAGVLDAGDTATRLGTVLQLEQSGVGHNQFVDISGNEMHGAVNGPLPANLPANYVEKFIDLTVTGNGSFTLPKGYKVTSVVAKETAGNALTGGLDMGLSANGVEIISGMAVAGSATVLCTLVEAGTIGGTFTTADDTIYFSDGDDDGNWNGAVLELRVQMQRIAVN